MSIALLKYIYIYFFGGSSILRNLLNSKISSLLVSREVVGDYTSHSCCTGAATTAVRVGLPNHLIKPLVVGLVMLISYASGHLSLKLKLKLFHQYC